MKKLYHFSLMALCWAITSVSADAKPYDSQWYETDFLGAEYPNGFSLREDKQILIRTDTDRDLAPSVKCALKKNATYHPWNAARVQADNVRFKSFSLIEKYTLKEPFTEQFVTVDGEKTVTLALKKGETWEYLTYYAEGAFRMRYKGIEYEAGQDLVEHSTGETPLDAEHRLDEWLGLTCANGAKGWILLSDVMGRPGFGSPKIPEYGKATDLDVLSPDDGAN